MTELGIKKLGLSNMFLLIRKETNTSIIYETRKIPRFLYFVVPGVILCLYLIPIILNQKATQGMLYYLLGLTGVIVLFILVETLDFGLMSIMTELSGKKIIKSGNWWTGDLKYEFEK